MRLRLRRRYHDLRRTLAYKAKQFDWWWYCNRPYRGVLMNRAGTWNYWHFTLGRWTIRIERKETGATA